MIEKAIMAQGSISNAINRHVEAVLVLSKHDILWRLITEAERCVQLKQVNAAAILAGIALEELYSSGEPNVVAQSAELIEAWRDLRNRAAHATSSQDVDTEGVAAMVSGIRIILEQTENNRDDPQSTARSEAAAITIRGKYAFVPTSVDDFLKRKREDLELENHQ